MALTELVGLSVGLAMDSTAVAASQGVAAARLRPRDVLRASLAFGGAHVLMPTAGWLAGGRIVAFADAYDHWIAFALLAALGLKMLVEAARSRHDAPAAPKPSPFAWGTLGPLAFATSLDALAAGLTLPMIGLGLGPSVACIGATNALLTAFGAYAGRHAGRRFGPGVEALGGLVLIGLGVKIVVEHLTAAR
jgi:putative Mn2+ efflux pump MntP